MSNIFMFEKPLGMRDTIPVVYGAKEHIRNGILSEMASWGYQMIETPALEYYETIGAASAIEDRQLFKLLDQQGHTLVLRPDMTAPIARVAASKLLEKRVPLRLAYGAKVYRAQQREGGRPAEFEQIGIECIGYPSVSADAETISLLISSLQKMGLKEFKVSVGHIGYLQDILLDVLGTEARAEICRKFLFEKNYVGFREHVASLPISSIDQQRLIGLLSLRGTVDVLEQGTAIAEGTDGTKVLEELGGLWEQLEEYGVQSFVQFDLTLVSTMNYYSGLLYEVYAEGVGMPVGNGGRYDHLLEQFGRKAPATGFALIVDRLLEALGGIEEKEESICVLYSREQFTEAISLAKDLRSKGMMVVLQDVNGVEEMDAFTRTFKEVHYLIGDRKGDLR
ncbi:ATP phosphoribosyltransferase regulatory subunit [Bacillus sp. 1P06AnD]|uniref:ATP phosphoribosyltransferase regulatory subunit n=1 Tax=Bacillus sp. 1P06AnD TaxID=3132208 RepID=UPI00399FBA93